MKVYKGTDENMVCHGKQYVPGEMATEEKAKLCECGLHACEMPLDVLKYYPPNCSRYFDAEADDVSDERSSDDSKIVAKKMTLKAEIGIPGLVKAQVEYIKKQIEFDDAIKRADAEKDFMGLTSWTGALPKRTDAEIAKNYLSSDELDTLNRIVSLYLDFAELQAKSHKPMYMKDWIQKLDDFLKLSGKELLSHAGKISAEIAKQKADTEYDKFKERTVYSLSPVEIHFLENFEKEQKKLKDR